MIFVWYFIFLKRRTVSIITDPLFDSKNSQVFIDELINDVLLDAWYISAACATLSSAVHISQVLVYYRYSWAWHYIHFDKKITVNTVLL